LEAENAKPKVKWGHEYDAAKSSGCPTLLWRSREDLLHCKQRQGRDCEHEPYIEIEKKISDVEMPLLSAIYLWSSSRSTEDVVQDNIEWNHNQLLVKERRY